jgi:hypothetical protein
MVAICAFWCAVSGMAQQTGQLYSVVVGVTKYEKSGMDLHWAHSDARKIYSILRSHSDPSRMALLTDSMAKNHACIELSVAEDGAFEYYLEDIGSSNGTFHNEKKVEKGDVLILRLGDRIRLGRTTFEFSLD